MVQEVVAGLDEPTCANQISVGGVVAVFERVRNLRFINRFGEEMVRPRRCYRYRDRGGSVAPLDVKVGLSGCVGFSPMMIRPQVASMAIQSAAILDSEVGYNRTSPQ